jgi:hypothetical protein
MAPGFPFDPPAEQQPWGWVPPAWNEFDEASFQNAMVGEQAGASPIDRLNLVQTIDPTGSPPGPVDMQALPSVVDPSGPVPVPVEQQLLSSAPAAPAVAPAIAADPDIQLPFAPPPAIETLPSVRDRPVQPPVDAVVGAAPLPPQAQDRLEGEQRYQGAAERLTTDPFDPATGDLRADVTDADAERWMSDLAMRDQGKFAEVSTKFSDAKMKRYIADKERLAREDYEREKDNLRIREESIKDARAKSAAIDADAQRIADTKIDPTVGGIAPILLGVIGGLIQGRTGSATNTGIDAIKHLIATKVDAQKANLANQREGIAGRRGALANEMALHGDDYRAREATRIAAYRYADNLLATEQQNYAPRGTRALKIANLRAQISGAEAEARHKRENELIDQGIKSREQIRKEAETDAQIKNQRAQVGLGYAQLESAKEERKAAKEAKAEERALERADKEAERVRQFSISSPRATVALDDKGQPIKGPDGKPVTTTERLTTRDGKPWLLGDSEDRRLVKSQIVAASEITDMLDQVLDIREQVGGEVMPWSDAKQKLKLLQERLRLVRKSGTHGMSSDKDFEALGASIGASNLTSFIDQSPGLKEARARTISELNSAMRASNYDGPAVDFPNKYAGAKNTPEDEHRKALIGSKDLSYDDALRRNLDKAFAERGRGYDANDPADHALYQRIAADTQAGAKQDHAAEVAKLGGAAANGDAAAHAVLNEIATKAESGKLRALAKAQLKELAPKPKASGPRTEAVAVPDELRLQ